VSEGPEPTESGEPNEEPEEAPDEQERTQTCRFCRGDMQMTGSTDRPRVSELMEMPLARFRRAQAGMRVTLGARLPQIEAQRRGDPSAPLMGRRAAEIRRQLITLATSGSL
jgi:hypothetical protein